MKYIEKLFKQYAFIYFIDGEYYAFGTGVCSKVDTGSVLLKSRYKDYVFALNNQVEEREAQRIFHKLVMEADSVKEKSYNKEMESFNKLKFTETNLKELEIQVEQYIEFWKKYNLKDFMN